MGFENWSLRDKAIMVWGLAIATVALVFVGVSLGNVISDNSANIASWVQAIGALIMVGISVSIFVIGESRRNKEKEEEMKLLVDEAKFFLIRHGSAFTGVYTYAFGNQLAFYKPDRSGEGKSLASFPAVTLFMQVIPQIERLHADFQEFMQMQVPMGVPKLCISHIHKHCTLVSQINSILDANRHNVQKIIELQKSYFCNLDDYELIMVKELEEQLGMYIPYLVKYNNELKNAHETMLKEIMRA